MIEVRGKESGSHRKRWEPVNYGIFGRRVSGGSEFPGLIFQVGAGELLATAKYGPEASTGYNLRFAAGSHEYFFVIIHE
jgi:hypothetical protein